MNDVLSFFAAMMAVANPVFQVPIWLDATQGESAFIRRRVAFLVSLTAAVVLVLAVLFGVPTLEFFNISLVAFQIGGGLILIHLGLQMLDGVAFQLSGKDDEEGDVGRRTRREFQRIATPVAVPLIAGPGAISTCIIYGARIESPMDGAFYVGIVIFTVAVIFGFLACGGTLTRIIGTTFFKLLPRVFSLILLAIGVQFIVDGLGQAFPAWRGGS